MKNILLVPLTLILLTASFKTSACEACGCNLGGSYFGITPQFNQHFLGLRYSSSTYKGAVVHTDGLLEDESSDDSFLKTELMGRIRVASKFQVGFILPYQVNIRNGSDEKTTLNGFGDPTVIGYFQPFKATTENTWKHALLVGAGVKLPLAKYNAAEDGELIHQNSQLGTGSLDLLLSANYTLRYKQWGLNTEQSLKLNGTNKDDYRFGNQLTSSANFFYWIQNPYVAILPVAGLQYEQAKRQFDGMIMQANSGGRVIYVNLGVQAFHKSWGFSGYYQKPLSQQFNTEEGVTIKAKNRFTVGFTKSFGGGAHKN